MSENVLVNFSFLSLSLPSFFIHIFRSLYINFILTSLLVTNLHRHTENYGLYVCLLVGRERDSVLLLAIHLYNLIVFLSLNPHALIEANETLSCTINFNKLERRARISIKLLFLELGVKHLSPKYINRIHGDVED